MPAPAAQLLLIKGGLISGADGGETYFFNQTNGGTATIMNEGGLASGASGGLTWFLQDVATAGSAVITCEGATVKWRFRRDDALSHSLNRRECHPHREWRIERRRWRSDSVPRRIEGRERAN